MTRILRTLAAALVAFVSTNPTDDSFLQLYNP